MGHHLGGHPGAGVADQDPDPLPRAPIGVLRGLGLVHGAVRRHDLQGTSPGHRVAGVHRQVHEHLLDLARVAEGRPELRREAHHQSHVLSQDAQEELLAPAHHVVQVEWNRGDHLLAREGQELAGQVPGPLPGGVDLGDVLLVHLLPGGAILLHGLGAAQDHRQEVVEVVRDPSRETTDALQPLRLPVLLLELLVLGHVAQVHDQRPHRRVAEEVPAGPLQASPAGPLALRPHGDPLARDGPLEQPGQGVRERHLVVGADLVDEALPEHLLLAPAQRLGRARAPEGDLPGGVEQHDQVGGALDEGPEPGLVLAQRGVGAVQRGHVVPGGDGAGLARDLGEPGGEQEVRHLPGPAPRSCVSRAARPPRGEARRRACRASSRRRTRRARRWSAPPPRRGSTPPARTRRRWHRRSAGRSTRVTRKPVWATPTMVASRCWLSRSSVSARFRSVTSRTKAWKRTSSAVADRTLTSTSMIRPSLRLYLVSNRSDPKDWIRAIRASIWPASSTTSSSVTRIARSSSLPYPVRAQYASFTSVNLPAPSSDTNPSMAVCRIVRSSRSRRSSARSASTRAVASRETPRTSTGRPSSLRT